MTAGDRVMVYATLQTGEMAHVQGDGRVCVWLDDQPGDALPTPFDAQELASLDMTGFSDGTV